MCGIAGFSAGGDERVIRSMTNALTHRGPDAMGIFQDGPLALGHRRLSIVDLSGGGQPMRDPHSGLVLVYNGEIYNHSEIRRELEKEGHVFQSDHSDTETVLHAFAQWGPDCFVRFNGMFALAIYDPRHARLWLARDRFGEKPLFYCHASKALGFASEIGALKLWPGFDHDKDRQNFQRFFAWNYMPGGRTLYASCKSLPPASFLRMDLKDGSISMERYWSFSLEPDENIKDAQEEELAEELRRLLVQAVKRRLLADVPLGIFLSGGIDSSAVLGAAVQLRAAESIESFTIGFNEKSFDESGKARQVAEHFGVRNSIRYLSEEEMRSSIATVLSRMSEPFGDASLIPSCQLCAFAREHVKVALSGDGGDELLGGYDPLAAIAPAGIYRKFVPDWLHSIGRRLMAAIPASDRNMSLEFRLKRVLKGLSWPETMQIPIWMSGLDPAQVREFFLDPLSADDLYRDALDLHRQFPKASPLAQAFLFFTRIYLSDDILVKSDRASMMVSLETRAVFLDNDLVDFCRKLPLRFKYRNGQRKYLLKKALQAWLPANIINQPKKGFGIPLNLWLRSLPMPNVHVPGLKEGVINYCHDLHKKRSGDFRFFLWDLQALSFLAA